ncbi:MAG: low molecular weight phosphatase family protein [Planctomyces sp.]|nr:low molecular weight phosphatase family protein [Planctomyces sp.]
MKNVLILCTGNSCRSQMAEGLWNSLGQGQWQAFSAGSKPAGYVHHLAVQAMAEIGLDIGKNESKSLNVYLTKPFDLVVTVCGNADDACPVFPGTGKKVHWPFFDPAHAPGTDDEKFAVFRRVRDEIKARIQLFLDKGE